MEYMILACSPRKNGNTDTAAELVRQIWSGWGSGQVARVADQSVLPCISCGFCRGHPGRCSLESRDGAKDLLLKLSEAEIACLAAPIYFYHMPAQAKALIDRCQMFWSAPYKPGQGRELGVILLGAREQGENLFKGALLTLRYAAEALGMLLAEPLLLYGLEEAHDLADEERKSERIRAYARQLASKAER